MRELLERANAANPQFRPICGFQPAFEADANMMQIVTAEATEADEFDLLYENKEVDVYIIQTQRRNGRIKLYDIKLIGDLRGYEEWLVVEGLIAVSHISQFNSQLKRGKIKLIEAMRDIWGVELQKKGA